jgi:NADPH2:quinone reductase
MRAVQVDRPGDAGVLTPVEVPDPVPGPGEVLVRVAAAGVNFIDTYRRSGLYPVPMPHVPGSEGAGTIVALGAEVQGSHPDLVVGAVVAWVDAPSSYAELVLVRAERALPVPAGVSAEQAAAVALQGLTAHYLVTDTAPVGPGTTCLVHAGAGGVGLLLIQLAKARGATVFATVSSEEKAGLAVRAGADQVVRYERDGVDFAEAIEAVAGRRPLDVVFDGVGRATFDRGLDLLRPRGIMVSFGNASGPPLPVAPLRLSRGGSLYLTRPTLDDYVATPDELLRRARGVFTDVADGALDVRIGATFPLQEAAEAHRLLESRGSTGKVLLLP